MTKSVMDYYELRKVLSRVIPREKPLFFQKQKVHIAKTKGRKTGYQEYKLNQAKWVKQEKLLNDQEINSFIEISCRAAACPMPLNLDVWDGITCPYNCKYCFANTFRASLYTSFFDNSKTLGLRHCLPTKYKKEMDKLFQYRDYDPHDAPSSHAKAIAMRLPIRFGIRFEDFIQAEKRQGISLELLKYLGEHKYPLMINTKSDLIGEDAYIEALSKTRSAVHMTLITSNNTILKTLEPGAPSYKRRLTAMKNLVSVGIRVVARIEPYLVFVTDHKDDVERYIEDMQNIGVKNITFDTYSYTARNPGIRQSFKNVGIDYDRLFLLGCDSQASGSLLLGSFMQMFRDRGFSCSTFDMGNVPDNNQSICCEVGDWFGSGFNYGCSVMAARFIQSRKGKPTTWKQFHRYVESKGGFLSDALEQEVQYLWNAEGTLDAYSHSWARGMEAVGYERGIVWSWQDTDFRQEIYDNINRDFGI